MKLSGIYKIINKTNNHIYVGSAVDLKGRWSTHKNRLKDNKHHSIYLQRAYNKYGADNFVFEIIEECSKDDLIKREQYYFDLLKPNYNVAKIAGSSLGLKHSKESSLKKSLNHAFKGKFGKDSLSSIPLYQYDQNGNFIKKWHSGADVERDLSFCAANIRKTFKTHTLCYGFYWTPEYMGEKIDNVPKPKDRKRTKKPIEQYDLNWNFIKEWDSAIDASGAFLEKKKGGFANEALKDPSKTCYGFHWKYKEVDTIKKSSRIILQYSLDGELIKTWKSVSSILRFFNIKGTYQINKHLLGQTNEFQGFIWKYKK